MLCNAHVYLSCKKQQSARENQDPSRSTLLPPKRTPRYPLPPPQQTSPAISLGRLISRPALSHRRTISRTRHSDLWGRSRWHTATAATGEVTGVFDTLSYFPISTTCNTSNLVASVALRSCTITPLIIRKILRRSSEPSFIVGDIFRCWCIASSRMRKIFLSSPFDGGFVVRVKADSASGISAYALTVLCIGASTGCCGVFEEEV